LTPKQWFVLAVRVIGVWTLLKALTTFVTAHNIIEGFVPPSPSTRAVGWVLYGAVDAVAGLYLLLGAPHLAGVVCRNDERTPEASDDDTGADTPDPEAQPIE
jgi:hypothetical protein